MQALNPSKSAGAVSGTSAPRAAAPATPQASDVRRTRVLSGVAEASVDIRKACNGIKRTAALGAAAMVCGLDPKDTAAAAERMALDVLKSIGFDIQDEQRMASVLPMMLEATSAVIADAAYHAKEAGLGPEALAQAAKGGVAVLSEIAKSRAVAKMVEPAYPTDMDAIVALRLTAASAMANVAVEVAAFDFMHTAAECIKEGGKTVVKAAMDASKALAPAQASANSRLMLTQSLMQSAARVYAATWRATAVDETARLDALSDAACNAELERMEKTSLAALLGPVNQRFQAAFEAIAQSANELLATSAAQTVAAPRPSTSMPRPR